MKRWKAISVLSLIVLVIGGAFALAEEPTDEILSPRARILSILQDHPEVWAEIQALQEDLQGSRESDGECEFFGMMGARMRDRDHRRTFRGEAEQRAGYGPKMRPRWNY